MKVTGFLILDDVAGLAQFLFDDGYQLTFKKRQGKVETELVSLAPQDNRDKKSSVVEYNCLRSDLSSKALSAETSKLLKQHWLAALSYLEAFAAGPPTVIEFMWLIFKGTKPLAQKLKG